MSITEFLTKDIRDVLAGPPSDQQMSLQTTITKSIVELSALPQFLTIAEYRGVPVEVMHSVTGCVVKRDRLSLLLTWSLVSGDARGGSINALTDVTTINKYVNAMRLEAASVYRST